MQPFLLHLDMKTVSVLIFLIIISYNSFSQNIYFKYQIFLDVSRGYLLYSFNKIDSSVITNWGSEESKPIKVFNNNKKGTLKFILSDSQRSIFIKGQYYESSIIKNNIAIPKRGVYRATSSWAHPSSAKYYYRPIRDGVWYYYNALGKVIKIENYKNGKLTP